MLIILSYSVGSEYKNISVNGEDEVISNFQSYEVVYLLPLIFQVLYTTMQQGLERS